MREVTVSRFVPRSPPTLARMLTPEAMVEYEGSFEVRDVQDRTDGTFVTVGGRGVEFVLRFEETDDGLRYEQAGQAGPFDAMETAVTVDADSDGSTVTARSSVSLGLPLPSLTDRVAAWKRRGELERALDAVVEDC
ncbi:hypothetical protein SAMN04488063_3555 [Halopelagius inordinatus]|uniref:Polyketide cyclase / dehydrase and lipid transport n=1 Tax=Halopelagius inordinatus TaxID=553467 RepID=A0A1I2WGJ9_9EURY|nr:polyketide cyclase [Halopelagius inordinatus]SFH00482.1 hypothetical protein SAMN04488063_3555 [Halopelagius inordinatus]